jgi:DNA polymerase elongation subunit (family B)
MHTGFAISFEGIYKWIAFVHSKSSKHVPVPNRYFGVFEDDGSLKVRGLEIRRRDNPPFLTSSKQKFYRSLPRAIPSKKSG